MAGIKSYESKYGITITNDSFTNPLTGNYQKRYKIYTTDGCLWENGLTYRGLQQEIKTSRDKFLQIKANTLTENIII